MPSQPLLRGWITICLMTILVINSDFNLGLSLPWAFLYSLLSHSLACKYAQEHVPLSTCCCWHSDWLLRNRDEVKGKDPIVYEETFFETRTPFCMTFLWFFFFWWYFSGHQQISCTLDLKTDMRFAASTLVVVMHENLPALTDVSVVFFYMLVLEHSEYLQLVVFYQH